MNSMNPRGSLFLSVFTFAMFGVFLLLPPILSRSLQAQDVDAAAKQQAVQEKVAALKESVAKNQAALKLYSWNEATEVSLKGEVKKNEQKECRYGPDGKVQKTPIAGSDEPKQAEEQGGKKGGRRGGAVKKKVVQKKTDELKEYMQQVGALVHLYVPPDRDKIQSAVKAGKVAADRSTEGGLTALTFSDYAKEEDRLELGFDSAAGKIRTYNVTSYLEEPDEVVTLSVNFDSLPDGTNYAKEIVLDAKSKQILVRITNARYQKVGP